MRIKHIVQPWQADIGGRSKDSPTLGQCISLAWSWRLKCLKIPGAKSKREMKKSLTIPVSGVCIGQLGQVDLWWVGQTKAQKDAWY